MFPLVTFAFALTAQAPSWPPIDDDIGRLGGGERDAAVVVGVTKYFALPQVPGARENAEAWQQYLLRARGVPAQHVVGLFDEIGSREKILAAAKQAARSAKPGGTLWFVFVGHGAPNQAGSDGLLLGADTLPDADSVAGRGVAQEEVLALLQAGAQKETVVVFDACFSGKTGDGAVDLVPGTQATLPTRRAAAAKATVLAASDSFAGALPGTTRPAFSYLLLGAVRGWGAAKGAASVTLDDAYAFTRQTMQAVLRREDRLPSRRGQVTSSLSLPAKAARPDVDALAAGRCPSGWAWEGVRCKEALKVKCPAGTTWKGDACESLCPPGTTWDGDGCAATRVKCPAGTSWTGTACAAPQLAVLPAAAPAPSTKPPLSSRRAGATWRDDKATWVWHPAGSFMAGCELPSPLCDPREVEDFWRERRDVPKGFWMMQTEVRMASYSACMAAGACAAPARKGLPSEGSWSTACNLAKRRPDHPMNCVTRDEARGYCRFAGGRLPTHLEWEYAAKGAGKREAPLYPWGDAPLTSAHANSNGADGWPDTSPVGSFPQGDTALGLKDMAGNVWEFVESNYYENLGMRSAEVRGGSFRMPGATQFRTAFRYSYAHDGSEDEVGFRCVLDDAPAGEPY